MNARLKAFLGLSVLFALGLATGIMLAPHFYPHDTVKPFPAGAWVKTTVSDYHTQFSLSATQVETLRQAAEKAAADILRVRRDAQEQIRTCVKAMNSTLLPTLDPNQRAAFESWLEKRRAKLTVE